MMEEWIHVFVEGLRDGEIRYRLKNQNYTKMTMDEIGLYLEMQSQDRGRDTKVTFGGTGGFEQRRRRFGSPAYSPGRRRNYSPNGRYNGVRNNSQTRDGNKSPDGEKRTSRVEFDGINYTERMNKLGLDPRCCAYCEEDGHRAKDCREKRRCGQCGGNHPKLFCYEFWSNKSKSVYKKGEEGRS